VKQPSRVQAITLERVQRLPFKVFFFLELGVALWSNDLVSILDCLMTLMPAFAIPSSVSSTALVAVVVVLSVVTVAP